MTDDVEANIETSSGTKITITGNAEDVKNIISHIERGIPKKKSTSKKSKTSKRNKVTSSEAPIPFDIKSNNQKPSLRDFYEKKAPSNHRENLAVYVYYIHNYVKEKEIKKGHVAYAYKATMQKRPNIDQLIRDTRNGPGYVGYNRKTGNIHLTQIGEDFVDLDLPRKSNDSADKSKS